MSAQGERQQSAIELIFSPRRPSKWYRSKVRKFAEIFDLTINFLKSFIRICRLLQTSSYFHLCQMLILSHANAGNEFTDESIYAVFWNMSLSQSVIREAAWENGYNYIAMQFSSLLTDEGICFLFNNLNSHEIHTNEWVLFDKHFQMP